MNLQEKKRQGEEFELGLMFELVCRGELVMAEAAMEHSEDWAWLGLTSVIVSL